MDFYKRIITKQFTIFLALLLVCGFKLNAQITVTYPNIDDWVRKNFGGQGVVLGNITHKGSDKAIASFNSTKNVLKIPSGLLLSTGEATDAIGPNNAYNISKDFGYAIGHDKDLKAIEKGDLYDISFIEFDFVSFQNSINFKYQFASDEYPEYVGSSFNDIFAFFITDEKSTKNIAVIPGKTLPVSVNTINNKSEASLFINNNVFVNDISEKSIGNYNNTNAYLLPNKMWHGIKSVFAKSGNNADNEQQQPDQKLLKTVNEDLYTYLQYDGITQKLTAQAFVEPYKKYHLKIIIADVADNFYDSAVFLEGRSFTATKDITQPGFKDYADFSKIIDPKLILENKKLADILPPEIKIPNANIYFDFNKADITNKELEKVMQLVTLYDKIKDNYRIEITGNTDSIGSFKYNYKLSKTRCEAVINILQKNISNFRIDAVDYNSFTEPSSNNASENGRKLNRRVSVKFIRTKKNG
jgi:outer membrane protein OmpA-like peptidoglycan-associated protein